LQAQTDSHQLRPLPDESTLDAQELNSQRLVTSDNAMLIRWNTDCGVESEGFSLQVSFEPMPVPGAHQCEMIPNLYCVNYESALSFVIGGGLDSCSSGCEDDPDCTGGLYYHPDGTCFWFGVQGAGDHDCDLTGDDCGADCATFLCE
jgi:hypothetical protein